MCVIMMSDNDVEVAAPQTVSAEKVSDSRVLVPDNGHDMHACIEHRIRSDYKHGPASGNHGNHGNNGNPATTATTRTTGTTVSWWRVSHSAARRIVELSNA